MTAVTNGISRAPDLKTTTSVDKPVAVLTVICMLQVAMWTLAPTLVHQAPPLDVVESYLWGREWVWATFKHPSLPGWVLEASYILTGVTGWPAYLVSQVMIVMAFVLVFLIGRDLFGADLRGSQLALGGVLLLTGIYYYSVSSPEFNHNVPQIPCYAAVIFTLWRAVTRGGLIWWTALGIAGALGVHIKYSFGIVLAVACIWLIFEPKARRTLSGAGPWLTALVFLAGAAPQIHWLISSDFGPLSFAARRAAGATANSPFLLLLTQIVDHAGLFALATVAGLFRPLRAGPRPSLATGGLDLFAFRFLLTFALGPVMFSVVLALAVHTGMKDMWPMPMFNLSGLLLVALMVDRFTEASLRRLIIGAALLLAMVPVGYAVTVRLADPYLKKPLPVTWPQAAISERLSDLWRSETGRPLGIVAGDIWAAGLVALTAQGKPSIYIDGDRSRSPWITPERLAEEGALVVWLEKGNGTPPSQLAALIGTSTRRESTFDWPYMASHSPLRIGYAIVPPRSPLDAKALH
jgi:4-amino-4-deoxy-L-arabinose transferase-like glycosyltransferase